MIRASSLWLGRFARAHRAYSVIVGLSGGVDSAVSAYLLKQQGYDVRGVYMRNWNVEEETGQSVCPAKDDMRDAERIAKTLNIPFDTFDFEKEYWNDVFEVCLRAYEKGETPNPDVLCNRYIKFNVFASRCFQSGCDFIATGHYARINSHEPYSRFSHSPNHVGGRYELLKGVDPRKDQSYFLSEINGNVLSRVLFPVGSLLKTEVKEIARKAGLHVFDKKESMGICFIGERRMRSFLKDYLATTPGTIVNKEGQKMGDHDGLLYYTIGQGVKLSNSGVKYYVCEKDMASNTLVVCEKEDPALYRHSFYIREEDMKWLSPETESLLLSGCMSEAEYPIQCQLRYRTELYPCRIRREGDRLQVVSESKMRAVTPGQISVFYDRDVCLGGGRIDRVCVVC